MSKRVNRRIFLRGLGGAVVAAPFLSSVAERLARGASGPPEPGQRRLIAMFTHSGCITTRFFPTKSHGPLVAADLEPTTLAPLAPYVDRLLLPRGIRAMNEWTPYLERGQGNDPHTQVCGSYFTCQPVTPNSDDPFSFAAAAKYNARPVGPSLDHVIAQQLSSNGEPLVLRVGGYGETPQSAVSYSAPETYYPGIATLTEAFSRIAGVFQPGVPTAPDSYQAVRGKSILDLVRDDLETLERFDMSQSDRLKLAAWKELLNQTGGVVASAQCNPEVAASLGLTQATIDMVSSLGDRLSSEIGDTGLDGADLHSNLAVLAAACNHNPVTLLKYPSNIVLRGLGLKSENIGLSHRVGSASMSGTCIQDALEQLLTIDRFYARKFAHLVEKLDELGLLDDTAAVWFQEMSDGAAHNLNNLPIVQAGSAGGFFKTGWAVNVEDGRDDLSAGNSEHWCKDGALDEVMGHTQASGTDPSVANAPINKYYVSLMNALGVKAGDDGFPQVGGTAEVTKFGMYDKTEDFIGGGTNPPLIRSPGGFDALKA